MYGYENLGAKGTVWTTTAMHPDVKTFLDNDVLEGRIADTFSGNGVFNALVRSIYGTESVLNDCSEFTGATEVLGGSWNW